VRFCFVCATATAEKNAPNRTQQTHNLLNGSGQSALNYAICPLPRRLTKAAVRRRREEDIPNRLRQLSNTPACLHYYMRQRNVCFSFMTKAQYYWKNFSRLY